MKHEPRNVSSLYDFHPRLYNAIANDRDFRTEIDIIIKNLGYLPKVSLETFAGEALHAKQLSLRGVESHALDQSKAMKSTSLNLKNYIVGKLPDAIDLFDENTRFDLIIAMRFGIGHLDFERLTKFFEKTKDILSNRGIFAIEIHRNITPGQQFNDLDILERTTRSEEYGEITCSWPHGRIEWHGNKATMPVKVCYTKPQHTELYFCAPEFIYTQGEVTSMLGDIGMQTRVLNFSSYSKLVLASAIETKPK